MLKKGKADLRLKGKVIKEFVPMAQKEQKVSEPVKLANEPAKSKTIVFHHT